MTEFHIYHILMMEYCVFHTNRQLQKNFQFSSFSDRKIYLLINTQNQEHVMRPESLYLF